MLSKDTKNQLQNKPLNEKEKKARKLTIKQRRWLKVYLETGNAAEAARRAYNCKNRIDAANIGYQNLQRINYTELLEEAGITDKLLLDKLLEGLGAEKKAKIGTMADFSTRLAYIRHIQELKDRNRVTGDEEEFTLTFKRKSTY